MPRQALHSDSVKIEQKPDILDHTEYEGDVVETDIELHRDINKDYLESLAFQEEPVKIILNPSTEKNAPSAFPVWVNGKGAEVFQMGQWMEIGYLPVGRPLTIKRKYLEVIIRAKLDAITTVHEDSSVERPRNGISRNTSAVHSFSILEDKNPKGQAWAQDMIRRNM